MDLKIISPGPEGFIKAIEWNHEEIKQEMAAKVADYKATVYDDDQIKEAKADRAELNKLIKTLEDKRKEIKKQCLEPYEKFEKQMKELVAIVQEPVELIDKQVKAYEEKQKVLKLQQIRHIYEGLDFNGFEFYQIENIKWLNASYSITAIEEELKNKAEEIAADLQIIKDQPEFVFEATETYKATQDLKAALTTIKQHQEAAKKKAEWEAQQQAELEAKVEAQQAQEEEKEAAAEETPAEEETIPEWTQDEATDEDFMPDFDSIPDSRRWVVIKAFMNEDQQQQVEAFLQQIGAPFETV